MLPEPRARPSKTRGAGTHGKRSLIPFFGSALRGLFGTATMDDLKQLEAHVSDTEKLVNAMAGSISKNAETMTSFIKASNKRLDLFAQQIDKQGETISALYKRLDRENIKRNFISLQYITYVVESIQNFTDIHDKVSELVGAINSLLQGNISPHLIDPPSMQ
jgi:transcriptional regulator